MSQKIVIVLDCGATNVRSVAVNEHGEIIAYKSYPNNTQPDPNYTGGIIWDIDEIWSKLVLATKEVISKINKTDIIGITVTTFGVDGAPMKKSGEMLYPVISWVCQRTAPIMDNIEKYISLERLYQINGVNTFSFNTINKFIWFKENKPEILDQMDYFVFMPSLLIHKLTGEFVTDTTMTGTSMMSDNKTRNFSTEIMDAIGIVNKFPPMVEPGKVVGKVNKRVSEETGLPLGTLVMAAGHDTQFAIFGSGVGINEPVLSSGTWEILMVRTPNIKLNKDAFEEGITTEFDAMSGLFNPGIQWQASGILETIKNNFFTDVMNNPNIYDIMINEAEAILETDIEINPDFFNTNGEIGNLNINTKRGEIYKAALIALSQKTKRSLQLLEQNCGFKSSSLTVVGGGSKNKLWNQLRSKALGLPIKTIPQTETTVLGAAMFAFAGCGQYKSPEEARNHFLNL